MEITRLKEGDFTLAEKIIITFPQDLSDNDIPASEKHIENLLVNENCYLLAAVDDQRIAGFALAYTFPSFYTTANTAYLYDIEVLPDYRKRGIGRKLIEQLHTALKKDNVNEIWLGTAIENAPAQKLFSSTGAEKEEEAFYEYFYYLDKL